MNAYRLNEMEWWAGETAEQAIQAALETTGVPREDLVDDMYFTGEPESRDLPVADEDGQSTGDTVGDLLDAMTEPGFVCGTDF